MADEALRMEAEVRDKFSGPLKALRAQLLDVSREGARNGETLAKGLNKAEAAAQATANTAKTVLNPALAGLGITGLTAGVAVTGIISALNSLGSNLSSLGQLSRETGMAADQLRIFQSVAGKFGISSDASASAAQVFSRNMRDIRRGVGDTMAFLQSQSPAVAEFAIKLRGTKNNDEANRLTEDFLEQIPDAVDRGRLAERIYGNADLGRLGDRHLGPIAKLNAGAEAKLGPLPAGAVESAERYERAIGNLRSSMQRIGTTIATELLVPAERFTSWIDDLASGRRKELTDGIRRGMHDIGDELGKIPWAEAGESAKQMLLATTALVQPLANSVKEVAAAIRSFNEGKPLEALRHLDGGHGPLARKLAPLPGDEKYVNEEAIGALRGKIGTAQEQSALQADLLKDLQERGDKDGVKRLREAMDANSRHLKELEAALQKLLDQGATAQKSSLDGDGPFGGARVQSAAFLGGGGFRRLPGLGGGANPSGGGSGPGYIGEQGERGALHKQFRQHLRRTVPGYDGGDTVPLAPGAKVPEMATGGRLQGIGGGSAPRGDDSGGAGAARTGQMMAYAMDQLRREGVPEERLREAAAHLVGQATMESGLDPNKRHDYDARQGRYTGFGIYGARDPSPGRGRMTSMLRWLEENGYGRNSAEGQMREMAHSAMSGRYPRTRSILMGSGSGDLERDTNAITKEFESPAVINRRSGAVRNALRVGPEATSRLSGLPRPDGAQADGEGWAAREKARKNFDEQMRRDESRLDAAASRAGIVAGPKIENNGSVSVVVQKPGPDTNVRTSASGNLFKDVVLSRGRTMAGAGST